MDRLKAELKGIVSWIQQTKESNEQSRQHPGLDISKVSENEEFRLIIPKSINKPSDFIGIWLYTLSERPIWKEELRMELAERCKRANYRKLWMQLHKILKLDRLDLAVYILLENYFTGRQLRGNILPRALKRKKFIKFLLCKKKKPFYSEFHRGYRDKGGRRLVHEIHSAYETKGPNPEKLDFREKLKKSNFLLNFLYN